MNEVVSFSPQRLLVTGGAGFIGSNFVLYWLREHRRTRVVVLDALTYAGNRRNLSSVTDDDRFLFVEGDIADESLVERLLRDERIDTLIHFAAESHVDRSIHGPDAFLATNVLGTHSLLKAARRVWLNDPDAPADHRFHHVSTDEVYGSLGPADAPFTEATPYAPNSPYSASKASSDHLVRAYHHTYGLRVLTSNCSNNYGPYQFPEKLIPLVLVNILEGRPLPIYGDGMNVRDWLHVDDHCAGIERCLLHGRTGETYNLGGENEWTNIDIVRTLCRILDDRIAGDASLAVRFPNSPAAQGRRAESLITFVTDRAGHDRRYAVDTARARHELGYHPQETFETGIRKTVDWYLANEEWWRSVMEGSYRTWIDLNYSTPRP